MGSTTRDFGGGGYRASANDTPLCLPDWFWCHGCVPKPRLGLARTSPERSIAELTVELEQTNLRHAFEHGLLRIMSKSGISSVSSYRGAKLFTPIGLSQSLLDEFFCGLSSPVGGLELSDIAQRAIDDQRNDAGSVGATKDLQIQKKAVMTAKVSSTQ